MDNSNYRKKAGEQSGRNIATKKRKLIGTDFGIKNDVMNVLNEIQTKDKKECVKEWKKKEIRKYKSFQVALKRRGERK